MHKHCLLILLLGLAWPAFGQGPATVYIPEVGKSGQMVSSKVVKGETINRVIALPDGHAYK